MQSFAVPSAIYAMRLPCGEYARAKAPGWAVRLDRSIPSIEQSPDGWFYCGCPTKEHRFRWELPVPPVAPEKMDEGWAV